MLSLDARGRAARRLMRAYTNGPRHEKFETRPKPDRGSDAEGRGLNHGPGTRFRSATSIATTRAPAPLRAERTHYGMYGTPWRPAPKWALVSRGRAGQQAHRSLKAEVTGRPPRQPDRSYIRQRRGVLRRRSSSRRRQLSAPSSASTATSKAGGAARRCCPPSSSFRRGSTHRVEPCARPVPCSLRCCRWPLKL
jgi:hypothetical protein